MDRLVRLGFSGLILFCASLLYAGGFFFGATGGSSGGGGGGGGSGGSSCSISSDWANVNCSSATSCSTTSATKTLTVPGGNPGTLTFSGFSHTVQYSKNAGTFTAVASGGTVTFTDGSTIALKILTLGPTETDDVTVTDTTTSGYVGSFTGTNTHL